MIGLALRRTRSYDGSERQVRRRSADRNRLIISNHYGLGRSVPLEAIGELQAQFAGLSYHRRGPVAAIGRVVEIDETGVLDTANS